MSTDRDLSPLPEFYLLIPAAGLSTRMGGNTPKPFIKVKSQCILQHTLNKFTKFKSLMGIVNVTNENYAPLCKDITQQVKNCKTTKGSKSRKSSVYNGLKSFSNLKDDCIILVHDAARPLIDPNEIEAILRTMQQDNVVAATLACPISDSLLQNDTTVNRENMWAIQTPQAFRYSVIKEAHEKFKDNDDFTDDASLVRAMGHKVEIVPSSRQNIKITTPDDLHYFENIIANNTAQKTETRSAIGYDVHAFEDKPSERKLILGGIEIKHDVALKGHSDADVVLHAITDAILGAINEGDIGTHFPPSDPKWKDADSALFLRFANSQLQSPQYQGMLNFVDVTIQAEEPKIGPHRQAMQTRIAEILDITPNRVSIKATTTEQLGFTGRKEGIACHAMVTVELVVPS